MTDDHRDERLAERLRVEPLDDVTRARLVRTALAAAPAPAVASAATARRSARTRVFSVAAVLVLVLAVGLAVLVRNDPDSGTTSTAARAPKPADELEGSRASSTWDGAVSLGALGDVGGTATLRRAVRASDAFVALGDASAAFTPSRETMLADPGTDMAFQTVVTTCDLSAVIRLGRTIATGTGTADGALVTVYVVERADKSRVAVVVGPDCTVRKPVRL